MHNTSDFNKCLSLRFGEIFLKGQNKHQFIIQLQKNINFQFKNFSNISIKLLHNEFRIYYRDENLDKLLALSQKIFGVSKIYSYFKISENFTLNIENSISKISNFFCNKYINAKNKFTFFVRCKYQIKNLPITSKELEATIGTKISQIMNWEVDFKNGIPVKIVVDYYQNLFFIDKEVTGLGGLPVGSIGGGLSLLSGGFDSPISSFLSMKRGISLDFVTFKVETVDDETLINKKIIPIIKILNQYKCSFSKLFIIDLSLINQEIKCIVRPMNWIIITRIIFILITQQLQEKFRQHKYQCIVTGDNLGQVASQTLKSLQCISSYEKTLVFRPLIMYDKLEIIKLAKLINTENISKIKCSDYCATLSNKGKNFAPLINEINEDFNKIDYKFLNDLLSKIINSARIVRIDDNIL